MIDGVCERCGDSIEEVNVESWETTGEFLCADCAESAFESAGSEEYPDPRDDEDWKRHAE